MRMRPILAATALALLVTLGSAVTAHAQGFISPFIGYNFGGDAGCPTAFGCENRYLNWGVSAGAFAGIFGGEVEFAYSPDFFGDSPIGSSSHLTLFANFMVAPKIGFVQPYALAGLGLMKTAVELSVAGLLESDNNHLGWDVGGGVIFYAGDHIGFKGDIRYFHAFQALELFGIELGNTRLDYGRVSGAVVFRF